MPGKSQTTFSIDQALRSAPALQRLSGQLERAATRMAIVRPLLPPALRSDVASGGSSDDTWCLLVPHHAAASKLRHLLPRLQQALEAAGDPVQRIRVKVSRRV